MPWQASRALLTLNQQKAPPGMSTVVPYIKPFQSKLQVRPTVRRFTSTLTVENLSIFLTKIGLIMKARILLCSARSARACLSRPMKQPRRNSKGASHEINEMGLPLTIKLGEARAHTHSGRNGILGRD